jgi:hypothetical protein
MTDRLALNAPPANGGAFAPIGGLSGTDGRSLAVARRMLGQTVSFRGWASPMPSPNRCLLSEGRVLYCQLCGDLHFDGASVAIHADGRLPSLPDDRPLGFTGRLDIWTPPDPTFFEPQLRLVDARLVADGEE